VVADHWRFLNDCFQGEPAVRWKLATVSSWPLPVIGQFQKANLNTGHSDL
jgi:hypothetical protein